MTEPPVVALISSDLRAIARVEDAARRAGKEVVVVAPDAIPESAVLVVLDLDALGADEVASLDLPSGSVGYYSHVDESLAAAAHRAGIEAVPRGRFWRELSDRLAG